MKKMLLVLFVVSTMAIAVPAFAQVTFNNQKGIDQDVLIGSPSATITSPVNNNQIGQTIGNVGNLSNVGNPTNTVNTTIKPEINTNIGSGIGNFSPSAKATIEKGAVDIDNKNVNVNKNTNIQGQKQGQSQKQSQGQGQFQGQNNEQSIAPIQEVTFKSPTQLLPPPSQSVPELNFGNGKMFDATDKLPNFAIFGIKALKAEAIKEVLSVNANIKFKKLYQAVLEDAAKVVNSKDCGATCDVRYQIIRAEAQKSWNTGGNVGGAGSGLATSGLGGGSGAASIIPNWGGTKADDLFTVIFVRVIL